MQSQTVAKVFKWSLIISLSIVLIRMAFPRFLSDTIIFFCIFIFIVSFIGTIYLFLKKFLFPPKKEVARPRNIDHGSAKWATRDEFFAAGHALMDVVNYTGGLWIGDWTVREKQGHLMTVAGSGQGKGACLIIPALLINPNGSFVVTDPKGENAFITARNQFERGQDVYILDPWGEQKKMGATHGIETAGFNPFDFIKADVHEMRDNCELIASYIVPHKPDVKDPYWDDRARALIKTCLMHIVTDMPESDHNFWTLYKMLRVSGNDWLSLLADMKLNPGCDGLISIAAEEFIGMDQTGPTMGGIRSNAQNATSIFESPQLRTSLANSDFNPYVLTEGKSTLYIVIPERFLETHSAWLRLVIGICLKACNSKPDKRVNFLLDEAGVIGKMKDIEKAYAFSRGQNIVMWTFFQSLSQVKEIYGENGMNSLISNTTIFQAFGSKDQFTKEYVSKALGEITLIKESTNYGSNNSSGGSGSSSGSSSGTSYSSFGRLLLTPEEVEKFPHIINLSGGLKYSMRKAGYHQNLFDGMDWKDPSLTDFQRKLLKDGHPLVDMREVFAARADAPPRIYA